MSPKRTTAPPPQEHSRSSSSRRNRLIAPEKTKKQSARKRTVLDNRFHRTLLSVPWQGAVPDPEDPMTLRTKLLLWFIVLHLVFAGLAVVVLMENQNWLFAVEGAFVILILFSS